MIKYFIFFLCLILPYSLKAEWQEYEKLKHQDSIWSMIWNDDIINAEKSSIWIYHGTNYEKEFQEAKSVIIKSKISCYKNNTHTVHNLKMNFYSQQQKNPPKANFLRENLNFSVTSNDMGWKPDSCKYGYIKLCKLVCKRYFNID